MRAGNALLLGFIAGCAIVVFSLIATKLGNDDPEQVRPTQSSVNELGRETKESVKHLSFPISNFCALKVNQSNPLCKGQ